MSAAATPQFRFTVIVEHPASDWSAMELDALKLSGLQDGVFGGLAGDAYITVTWPAASYDEAVKRVSNIVETAVARNVIGVQREPDWQQN